MLAHPLIRLQNLHAHTDFYLIGINCGVKQVIKLEASQPQQSQPTMYVFK